MQENSVIVYQAEEPVYPSLPPFHPSQAYPEYEFGENVCSAINVVYSAVRNALYLAGLDREHFGTAEWNPLSEFIKPGQFVLLKPNLVKEYHPRDPNGWIYTVTHGSIIRAVADYVWKALRGNGRLVVADAPQTDSSFELIARLLSIDVIRDFYRAKGLDLEIVDLRKEEWVNAEEVIVERHQLPGDPNGYIAYNLSDKSEFVGHNGAGRYYGADYDVGEVNRHHSEGRHEYLVAGSAIKCDVFINLPKLKTHKKSGITVNLKNLVGVNGDKNWLPHHTVGSPRNGGDQYPEFSLKQKIEHYSANTLRKMALAVPGGGTMLLRKIRHPGKAIFGDGSTVIRSGNWYGNDTTWRMCLDLNKLVLYGNSDSTFRPASLFYRKTFLSFVDGIIAGQGNGPMDPDPINAGILLFGSNPVHVDAVAAVIMGYNPNKIPLVRQAFETAGFPLTQERWESLFCISNRNTWNGRLEKLYFSDDLLHFRPHFGWAGHIEKGE